MAVRRASAQKQGGSEACMRRVRRMSLMDRRDRSAFPFCGDVYGQENRRRVPIERKKLRLLALSNSRPLSH